MDDTTELSYHATCELISKNPRLSWLDGDDYDDAKIDELAQNCSSSFVREALAIYYCNSVASIVFYIMALALLLRRMKQNRVKILPLFLLAAVASEAIQMIAKNLYQRMALPIRGGRIINGVVYTGFYTKYSNSIQRILEEIMLGVYVWQNVLAVALHCYIILHFYRKKTFFLIPFGSAFFIIVQTASIYFQSISNADYQRSTNWLTLLLQASSLISWLSCMLLGNHITYNIFLKLSSRVILAEKHLQVSRAIIWVVFLNFAEAYPRACAWILLICTWRIVKSYVPFYTVYYEGYLIIVMMEATKYASGLKILLLFNAIKEIF